MKISFDTLILTSQYPAENLLLANLGQLRCVDSAIGTTR